MPRRRKSLLPPYVKWRDGRPRWEPGPKLRAVGWSGRDLKNDAGEWLGLEAAIAAGTEINTHVAAWRQGNPRRQEPKRNPRSCAALIELFFASQDYQRLAPYTRTDYRNKAMLWLDQGFADAPVAALTKPIMVGWWEKTYSERGHAMANGMLAVIRRALSYAELKGWRPPNSNPCRSLARPTLPPRVVVFSPREINALMAAADGAGDLGLAVGDAITLALHTGQRLSDTLGLDVPRLERGRYQFSLQQAKRKARVTVPATDQIRARMDAIAERRRRGPVAPLTFDGPLILDPRTGRPFNSHSFNKAWRPIRAAASQELPAIADKKFLDLRDTAITRLALADCTIPEIRAITGHNLQTIHQVLEHYLALDDAMAASAITKLQIWMKAEGIAL